MSKLKLAYLFDPEYLQISLEKFVDSEIELLPFRSINGLVSSVLTFDKALVLIFYPTLPSEIKQFIAAIKTSHPHVKFVHVGDEGQSIAAWQMRLFHFSALPFTETNLKDIIYYYKSQLGYQNTKLSYKDNEGLHKVELSDILYFRADGNYTEIKLRQKKKIVLTKQLGQICETLPYFPSLVRVNRSWIINLENISSIDNSILRFWTNDEEIELSREMSKTLKKLLTSKGII